MAGEEGLRTPNPRFWRPVLYQLSYTPTDVSFCRNMRTDARPAGALSVRLADCGPGRGVHRPSADGRPTDAVWTAPEKGPWGEQVDVWPGSGGCAGDRIGPHGGHASRPRPDRRFRQPGDPADRPAGARGRRLLRDPSVLEGRRGLRAAAAQGGDPLRRPGLGPRGRQPARARVDLRGRRAGARHLLRPADAVRSSSAARSRAAMRASSAAPRSGSSRTAPLFDGVWDKAGASRCG